MIDKKPTGLTGVVPIDAEHGRYAYMVNGLTIWAGTQAKCWLRYEMAMLKQNPAPSGEGMERAIRVLG